MLFLPGCDSNLFCAQHFVNLTTFYSGIFRCGGVGADFKAKMEWWWLWTHVKAKIQECCGRGRQGQDPGLEEQWCGQRGVVAFCAVTLGCCCAKNV